MEQIGWLLLLVVSYMTPWDFIWVGGLLIFLLWATFQAWIENRP